MDRKSKTALHVEDIVSATGCEIYLPVPEIGTDGTYQTKQSGTEMLAYHGSCDMYLLRYRRSEARKSVLVDITDETHSILVDITLNKLVERKLRYFKKSDTWYEFWIHLADKNYNTCVKLDKEDEGFSHFSDNLQRVLKNLAKCRNTKTVPEYMYKMVGIQSSTGDKTTKEMQKTRLDLNPVVEEEQETKGGRRKRESNGDRELANDKNEFADDEDSDGQTETESSSESSTSAEDDAVEVKEDRTYLMPPPFVLRKFHTLQSTLHKPKNTSDNQFGKSLYIKSTSADMPTKKDLFVERIPSAKSVMQQIQDEGDNDEENDEENNKITSYAQNENASSGDGTPVSENKIPRVQECNWTLPVKDFMFDHVCLAKHVLKNQHPDDSNESDTEYLEMAEKKEAEKKDYRKRQPSDPRFENRNINDECSNVPSSLMEDDNDNNTSKVGDFMFDHIPSAHTVVSFKRAAEDDKSREKEQTTDVENSGLNSAITDTTGQAIYLNRYDKISTVVNNTEGDKGTVDKNGTTTDAMGQKIYKEIKNKNDSDGATNNATTDALDQTIFLEMKDRNTSDYVSNVAWATVYEPMTNKNNSVSPMVSPQQMLVDLLQKAINSQDQGNAAEYAQSLAATGTRVKILLDTG